MGSRNCLNEACHATGLSEWKKGWTFKSGGFATLCYKCGSAYENSVFCDTFHSDESGWRECRMCGKRIHCGCIASSYLFEFMDSGGIGCIACVKHLEANSVQSMQMLAVIPNGSTLATNGATDVHSMAVENNKIEADKFGTGNVLLQLTKAMEANDGNSPSEQIKREEPVFKTGECSKIFPNLPQQGSSCAYVRPEKSRQRQGIKDMYHSLAQPSLNYSLTSSLNTPSPVNPFHAGNVEGNEQNKSSPLTQGQKARHIMPKPPKPSPTSGFEANRGTVSPGRVARPPAEGRGRNQLLPRYWPRITDQELQKLSGEFNSTIVPLFEKILSASDAGRIGRLVLPKACAEAYFPAINQSEGIPIRIQDIKGKEWTFQFRFWPNNNSRMYVLEGVTPCIQNMQVQAGDTVTFSRIDPGGQLVIGCRKATNNADVQMSYQNNDSLGETSFMGATNNIFPNGGRICDDSLQQPMEISEKKKARNIKNKRLLMDTADINELRVMRVTWEEAQGLFRPNPDSVPAVTLVEDHEFEEFEEPPVFGKRTIYICGPSGEKEQLAQCDSCLKWRRLPPHILLSVKWTCSENTWDTDRASCSAPEEVNPRDLDYSYNNTETKQRRISENKASKEGEPSGLDALATAAVLGDNMGEIGGESNLTTRHPRHRPGCSCIVCIQPPSGKGKHEPSCRCNVCLTVRRRFKTLMMRKKKKQTDRAAELAQERNNANARIGLETGDIGGLSSLLSISNNYRNNNIHISNTNNNHGKEIILEEVNKLDLNSDPHKEDEMLTEAAGMSLTTLMNAAILPFDAFSEQNEVPTLRPCLASETLSHSKEENVGECKGVSSGNVSDSVSLGGANVNANANANANANEVISQGNVNGGGYVKENVSHGNVNGGGYVKENVSQGNVYGGITSIYANGGNLTSLYGSGSRGVSSTNVNRGVYSINVNDGVSLRNVNGGISSGDVNVSSANIHGGVTSGNVTNGGLSSGNIDGGVSINGVVSSGNANEIVTSASVNGVVTCANVAVSSGNGELEINRGEG